MALSFFSPNQILTPNLHSKPCQKRAFHLSDLSLDFDGGKHGFDRRRFNVTRSDWTLFLPQSDGSLLQIYVPTVLELVSAGDVLRVSVHGSLQFERREKCFR